MINFAEMTHDWANFFSTLAQISGSLVGLVFVALTFNPRLLGDREDPILGTLASQTFADFMLLLLISLAMLIPNTTAMNVGAVVLMLATLDILRVAASLLRQRAHLLGRSNTGTLLQRFFLSFVGHVLLGWAGFDLLTSAGTADETGSLMVTGTFLLLLSGCRSAWLLIVHRER